MKTSVLKNFLLILISLTLVTGNDLIAQDNNKKPAEKKSKKTVHLIITSTDENGKTETTDTTFTTDETNKQIIYKDNIIINPDDTKYFNFDFDKFLPGDLALDSLEKHISDDYSLYINPDPDELALQGWMYNGYNDQDESDDHNCCNCPFCRFSKKFSDKLNSHSLISSDDIIKKFDIRKKKHGKKIIIHTEDNDELTLFPPSLPLPLLPPCPSTCKKKVIIAGNGKVYQQSDNNDMENVIKEKELKIKESEELLQQKVKAMEEKIKVMEQQQKELLEKQKAMKKSQEEVKAKQGK